MGLKTETAVEAGLAAGIGQKTTAIGAAGAAGGWFFSSEFAALAGFLIAVIGLLINWHFRKVEAGYKREQNEREKREHEVRMRQLEGQCRG